MNDFPAMESTSNLIQATKLKTTTEIVGYLRRKAAKVASRPSTCTIAVAAALRATADAIELGEAE